MAKGKSSSEGQGESVSAEQAPDSVGVVDVSQMNFSAPEGFIEQTDDVVGFWDGDKGYPLFFVPEAATLHDSGQDPTKVSVLIKGRLVEASEVYLGDEIDTAEPGDMVGVWAKPGMKAIRDLGGVQVWVRQTGEKDVGKKSPMKTFGVFSKTKGSPIPVVGDYRDKSKGVRHMLEGAPLSHTNPPLPSNMANGARDAGPGF